MFKLSTVAVVAALAAGAAVAGGFAAHSGVFVVDRHLDLFFLRTNAGDGVAAVFPAKRTGPG